MTEDSVNILFDKFEIIGCLKKDLGASVYSAHHIYLGKRIFLKTLDREKVTDPAMLPRFQREAKTLAQLDHPNIIKVLDFGTQGQFFYISFEYFESRNLREMIKSGHLSETEKKAVLVQLFRGLAYAHDHHVIHRDIKPENILLDDNNVLKIADFGLALVHGDAALTQQTSIVGTPSYMSPEQVRGEKLTVQSDLFSAGVVAYELFTGVNPFLGNDVGATLNNIFMKKISVQETEIQDASIRQVINSALQKNRQNRLPSAKAALALLGDSEESGTEKPIVRHRLFPAKLVAGLAVIALVISLWFIFSHQAKEPLASKKNVGVLDSLVIRPPSNSAAIETAMDSTAERALIAADPLIEVENQIFDTSEVPGRLTIQCQPWAHVYINGERRYTTPLQDAILLEPGEHEIQLRHPQFPTFVQNLRIESEKEYHLTATLYSVLACNVYPWGDIYLNGEILGQTPFEPIIIPPGQHVLTVENKQHGRINEEFSIAAGDTFYFSYSFIEQTLNP
ncbi:serine/threonine protein kinase [candidate division KSB1 bacterium]|nr:serine/threonine protein kinase [candidate division KSB1 bacterium]RQW05027.1 MAG: serine/threonine protein kinase [candidate division KSB1 bacterium]